jgi:hypothetical protein
MAKEIIQVRGIAQFPHLNTPDTKFEAHGVFKTTLELTAEVAAPLIERFTAERAAKAAEYEKMKKGKKAKLADLPIVPQTDEEGAETGAYELKLKMIASGTSFRTGKPYVRKLPLFDGGGKPTNARVGGGSELICAFEPNPWANAKGEVSVTCYLEAVQVLRLVDGGGATAGAYGFGAVDGAFAGKDREDDDQATPGETEGDDDGGQASYDFS